MSKRAAAYQRWRALLTETLPYEVPAIFTNDLFFISVAEDESDDDLRSAIGNLRQDLSVWSKPYNYEIVKDRFNYTTLGLIHPLKQVRISKFYDSYAETISVQCSRGNYSIRRPGEATPMFTEHNIDLASGNKEGIPRVEPEQGELDVSRITSYFTYKGYSLLSKFIDSPEYIRLEKRFSRLRTIDVAKCFFNIYTHSLSWAVRGKLTAKQYRNMHSFENAFDALMQRVNFNETNGIIIGPEVSRIFSEIILQAIDVEVERNLNEMKHNTDYAIRRYVDDYYIFADSEQELDKIQDEIRIGLESFKLFLNSNKISTSSRPFVSAITLARRDARQAFRELNVVVAQFTQTQGEVDYRRVARDISSKIGELRMIVGEYDVGFHTVSGWLIGSLRSLLSKLIALSNEPGFEARVGGLTDAAIALFEVIAYVVALDLRVRSTYSMAQVALDIDHFAKNSDNDHRDRIRHAVHQELSGLVRTAMSAWRDSKRTDSVELYNLLITAACVIGPATLEDKVIGEALGLVTTKNGQITYFGFIVAKFCYLTNRTKYASQLDVINDLAQARITGLTAEQLSEDTEAYFLLCDYLSSPDVTNAERRAVLANRPAQKLSNANLEKLGRHVGFVDWDGMRLEHLLRRKQLRPVYSSS